MRPFSRTELHAHGGAHRDVRGGGLRAAVFGVSDGLVTNVSLVLGTAAAHPGHGVVRLAGMAGLLGGAFSMGAGEYVSMSAQREALERELDVERDELASQPAAEQRELELIYIQRGVSRDVAEKLASELMKDPETALVTHAREELGIDTSSLGAPVQAAAASFFTFAIGALIPLIPFLGGTASSRSLIVSIVLAGLAALAVGSGLSYFTDRSRLFSSLRSFAICAVAGAATYGIGTLIGVSGS